MKLTRFLLLLLAGIALQACAPTGPVKFYEGANRPDDQIAKVMVPGPITVKSIDGRPVNVPSKESGFYELHLPPGKHLIAFKYELYWGSATSGMMVKSSLVAVNNDFKAGRVYELTYPRPENEDQAFAMSQQFSASLVDRQTGEKTASYTVENADTAMLAFTQQTTASGATPASSPAQGSPSDSSKTGALPDADQAAREDAVKRLKFWWLMASEAERKEFQKWMQQDMPNFNE